MAKYYNASPSFPFLSNLFGQGSKYMKKTGAYKLTGPTGEGLFGPGAGESISGYLNLTGPNVYTRALGEIGQTGNYNALPPELRDAYFTATGNLDELIGTSQPVVKALIETGLPVDIGSLVEAAKSRYANQFIPEALEKYNPATGSGFANIAAREANLMGTELGELDYQAQEAARARQIQGLTVAAPALAGLNTARLGLPGAVMGELAGLSQTSDPGGRLLAALTSLLGSTQQPSEYTYTGNRPYGGGGGGASGTGEALGGLSSILGIVGSLASVAGACWVAEELFGVDDPRTHAARLWVACHPDHPFVRMYTEEGIEWAHLVSTNAALREYVRPYWEWMARQGAKIARQLN